jgi:diacylglycerol kinase (ATP)
MANERSSSRSSAPVRWLAILNPAAGRGRAARRWPALARALDRHGVAWELRTTAAAGDGERIAREARLAGQRHFLAVGGDGTLHEIANGLIGGERCVLAVAPLGTGNDWARGLNSPSEPGAIARMLAAGRLRRVDAGRIEYTDDGARRARYFVNVAGAGYDAWVIERLPAGSPRGLAYLAAVLRGLWAYVAPRFDFAAPDTAFRVEASLFATFVALGPYCGGGMRFAPQADPTDGAFDLVAVPHLGPWAAVRRLPALYAGTLPRDPRVRYARAARASIDATPPARVEADGQLLGTTPARLEILPGAIDALVPATEESR